MMIPCDHSWLAAQDLTEPVLQDYEMEFKCPEDKKSVFSREAFVKIHLSKLWEWELDSFKMAAVGPWATSAKT